MKRIIGILPARIESQRLPGKMLLPIDQMPLIVHTYNRVFRWFDACYVATDSDDIIGACAAHGVPYIRTSTAHQNGTTRCLEAYQKLDHEADYLVNVQGDEVFMEEAILRPLLELLRNSSVEAATLCAKIQPEEEGHSNVFVVKNRVGEALYFSRAALPASRDGESIQRWQHIGVYAFSPNALEEYVHMAPSEMEEVEKLEQLRWLDHGRTWHLAEAPFKPLSVDTRQDYDRALQIFAQV